MPPCLDREREVRLHGKRAGTIRGLSLHEGETPVLVVERYDRERTPRWSARRGSPRESPSGRGRTTDISPPSAG